MTSTGNPKPDSKPDNETIQTTTGDDERISWSWVALLGMVGVLLCGALVMGVQLIGLFYSVLWPPIPPRPPDITELQYESRAYGVDTWHYGSAASACDIMRFYADAGGVCQRLSSCYDGDTRLHYGATCRGELAFSQFLMRWRMEIGDSRDSAYTTRFTLSREIFWGGQVPPDMDSLNRPALPAVNP